MSHVDGNAVAGAFADLLSFDVTVAVARCSGCGQQAELARAVVYRSDAGTVVRCSGCDAVLATVVVGEGRLWFGLSGISALEVRDGGLPEGVERG
jgi:ribosomal protein S27E